MPKSRSPLHGEVPRRSALTTIAGAVVAAPAVAQQNRPQREKRQQIPVEHKHEGMVNIKPPAVYKPKFFTAAQLDMLQVLVDLIIPRTDTPGASDAGVHRIIDSGVRPSQRKAWRDGLAWIESEAQKQSGKSFAGIAQPDQIAILQRASNEKNTPGARFFQLLKGATIDAYYNTREGLVMELGWNANTYLPEFKGCTHPEHQG